MSQGAKSHRKAGAQKPKHEERDLRSQLGDHEDSNVVPLNQHFSAAVATHKIHISPEYADKICGPQNANLNRIQTAFGYTLTRKNLVLSITAPDKAGVAKMTRLIRKLIAITEDGYNVNEETIDNLIAESQKEPPARTIKISDSKFITTLSPNQSAYVSSMDKNVITFADGVAGTGKTMLAVAWAVQRYNQDKRTDKIIIARPAIGTEGLGFLPGTLDEKVIPYLQPVIGYLEDYLGGPTNVEMMRGKHQIIVGAFENMRGATYHNAVVIVDEAQNLTDAQVDLLISRVGDNTKLILTGDKFQCDLPSSGKGRAVSGLAFAKAVMKNSPYAGIIELGEEDIFRSEVAADWIKRREKYMANKSGPSAPKP